MSSFGESLKRERELREISLREIADATKISIRYLEALEQNRFDVLPGGLFNKGFIRAYANFIGADGDALVDKYLLVMAARDLAATGTVDAGRPGPEGLHRPAEAPKRRAVAAEGPAPPSPSNSEPRPAPQPAPVVPHAPDPTLAKLAAAIEERRAHERSTGGLGRQRPLAVAGSVIGGAALVFALLLVARAVTSDRAPADGSSEVPSSQPPMDPDPSETLPLAESQNPPDAGLADAVAAPASQVVPVPDPAEDPPPVDRAQAAPTIHAPQPERRPDPPPQPARGAAPVPPAFESAATAPVEKTPARGTALSPMDLRLEATSPALVQVSCDGEDRLNRPLLPGEMATMRCFNLIRVSATDAGALRLVVNGRRCASLGEPGSRIQGFAIRSDDVESICPSRGGASDASR
jgi:cytoskeletal protein RodZ